MTMFRWGWGDMPLKRDPAMTRERAAGLLRSWRRNARFNGGGVVSVKRKGPGIYEVEDASGMTGTLQIIRTDG